MDQTVHPLIFEDYSTMDHVQGQDPCWTSRNKEPIKLPRKNSKRHEIVRGSLLKLLYDFTVTSELMRVTCLEKSHLMQEGNLNSDKSPKSLRSWWNEEGRAWWDTKLTSYAGTTHPREAGRANIPEDKGKTEDTQERDEKRLEKELWREKVRILVTLSNGLSNIPYLHGFYVNVYCSCSNLPLWIIFSLEYKLDVTKTLFLNLLLSSHNWCRLWKIPLSSRFA